jgi:hypothetical protein
VAIIAKAAGEHAAKCQQSVATQVRKCEAALLKSFVTCKKKGLAEARGRLLGANAMPGVQIPPAENQTFGFPLACADLAANGTSGMGLAAAANVFDVDLAGDIAFLFLLDCE